MPKTPKDRTATLNSMSIKDLKKLPAYKMLPPLFRKSTADKAKLVNYIKILESAMENDKNYPKKERDLRWVLHDIEMIKKYNCVDPWNTTKEAYSEIQRLEVEHFFMANEFRGEDGCLEATYLFEFNNWVINASDLKFNSEPTIMEIEQKKKEIQNETELVDLGFVREDKNCQKSSKYIKTYRINLVNKEKTDGHAIVALLDKKAKEFEIFDPHGALGSLIYLQDKFVPFIRKFLNLKNYNIFTTGEFCPVGPQVVLNVPICNMFSLFYLWLRVRHPMIPRKDIIDAYTSVYRSDMQQIMNNWQCYIIQSVKSSGAWDLLHHMNGVNRNIQPIIRTKEKQNEIKQKISDIYDMLVATGNVETAKRAFGELLHKIDVM